MGNCVVRPVMFCIALAAYDQQPDAPSTVPPRKHIEQRHAGIPLQRDAVLAGLPLRLTEVLLQRARREQIGQVGSSALST